MARLLLIIWLFILAQPVSAQTPTSTPPALLLYGPGHHDIEATGVYYELGSWSALNLDILLGGTTKRCTAGQCKLWFSFEGRYATLYYHSNSSTWTFTLCLDNTCTLVSNTTPPVGSIHAWNIDAGSAGVHLVSVERTEGELRPDSFWVFPYTEASGGGSTINYYVTYVPPTPDGATVYESIDNGAGQLQTVSFRYEATAGEFFIAALVVFQVAILVITFVLYLKRSVRRG